MVAFNPVILILFVDARDVIKVRVISVIYVSYDLAIAGRSIAFFRKAFAALASRRAVSRKSTN